MSWIVSVCAGVLEGSLLECRANLVIAPSHLTKQWQDEIEANCPTLRVIVITTKLQHEKVNQSHVCVHGGPKQFMPFYCL